VGIGILFGLIIAALKIFFKVFMFVGGYWFALIATALLLFEYTDWYTAGDWVNNPILYVIDQIALYVALILMALTTVQNTVKAVTKNPNFRIWHVISNKKAKERAITSPPAPVELTAAAPNGFIFGKKKAAFVRKPVTMDGHILTIGGAGSGKSSCLAIPSLMSWENRVFAVDIKGELYEKTKHKRPNIKVLNPLSATSEGYDPYYLLSRSRNPVQDAREIALAIIPTPKDAKEPFWVESAQNIFTGAILHFHGEGHSFPETITMIQSTPVETLVNQIHSSPTVDARYFANQLIGMDLKTLAGVFSEVSNKIMVFATDPDIKACLSKSTCITPEDIERGHDVYLNIPEDKIEQWKGLLTLIVNQFLKHFERRPDSAATPVLFLLDEFARLGKVETVINGLATLRSKKVTICILTQSLAQLDVIYGKEQRQVIADNCQYKAILNATDADTQDYFSRLVGTFDKAKHSTNANFEQYTGLGKGTGTSETTEEKRIIKPEEFSTLKDLVLLTPYGFTRIDKVPYFSTAEFSPPR